MPNLQFDLQFDFLLFEKITNSNGFKTNISFHLI